MAVEDADTERDIIVFHEFIDGDDLCCTEEFPKVVASVADILPKWLVLRAGGVPCPECAQFLAEMAAELEAEESEPPAVPDDA